MVFGDVNLSENPIRERHGVQFNPGAGGWPTIRYFNADTGPGGAPYEKVTDKAMCEELKDIEYMQGSAAAGDRGHGACPAIDCDVPNLAIELQGVS